MESHANDPLFAFREPWSLTGPCFTGTLVTNFTGLLRSGAIAHVVERATTNTFASWKAMVFHGQAMAGSMRSAMGEP
jgi:hypothetical protein